mmetsp:Transcript_42838/g.142584  ORF Transcript_42838/g.142584 Transcript_42838/m.142584 type:complete len:242 (+) Transcript_42838:1461-2186(+)
MAKCSGSLPPLSFSWAASGLEAIIASSSASESPRFIATNRASAPSCASCASSALCVVADSASASGAFSLAELSASLIARQVISRPSFPPTALPRFACERALPPNTSATSKSLSTTGDSFCHTFMNSFGSILFSPTRINQPRLWESIAAGPAEVFLTSARPAEMAAAVALDHWSSRAFNPILAAALGSSTLINASMRAATAFTDAPVPSSVCITSRSTFSGGGSGSEKGICTILSRYSQPLM